MAKKKTVRTRRKQTLLGMDGFLLEDVPKYVLEERITGEILDKTLLVEFEGLVFEDDPLTVVDELRKKNLRLGEAAKKAADNGNFDLTKRIKLREDLIICIEQAFVEDFAKAESEAEMMAEYDEGYAFYLETKGGSDV